MFEYLARMKKSKQKDANINALNALEQVVEYCTKPSCRRQFLLKFFGEKKTDPKSVCQGSCDYCKHPEEVTKTIEAASCVNDFSFQTKTEKEWDGQWNAPHGDDSDDLDDDDIDRSGLSESNGLSLMGEDVEEMPLRPMLRQLPTKAAGFSKASDVLAKYEKEEQREEKRGSKPRRKVAVPIIPEHLRKAAPKPLAQSKTEDVPRRSSADFEAEAARLKAELEELKASRDAPLSGGNKRDPPPPPPPPTLVFSKKRRRR